MSHTLKRENFYAPLSRAYSFTQALRRKATGAALALGLSIMAMPVLADPPVQNLDLPPVFCFRITDIVNTSGDDFSVEFEVLNWTDTPANGLRIASTIATDTSLSIAGNGVDSDGTPVNGPPLPPPGNQTKINNWTFSGAATGAGTDFSWDATADSNSPIPNIGLINIGNGRTEAQIVDQVNQAAQDMGMPFDPAFDPSNDLETVDNGPNVLDGFTLDVSDWQDDEVLSFNWFLMGDGLGAPGAGPSAGPSGKSPIGTVNGGDAFGFGVISLIRGDADNFPNGVFNGNTGFDNTSQLIFQGSPVEPSGLSGTAGAQDQFQVEMGAGITAPFQNPDDEISICGFIGCAGTNTTLQVPAPPVLGLVFLGLLGLSFRRPRG